MAAHPRFYLDENVPVAIAVQLRNRGIEVTTVRDLGMLSDTDVNHHERATAMGYVLCTYDSDYIQLATNGVQHAGIIFGQPEKHKIGEWVRDLDLIHAVYTAEEMKNRVEYL